MEKSSPPSEDTVAIVLNGKTYIPDQNMSFEQDMYLMSLLDEAGITPDTVKDLNLEKNAQEVILRAYRTGKLHEIVATSLVEKGKEMAVWSKESMLKMAQALADCKDKKVKAQLQSTMVALLLGFTFGVAESARISRNFSGGVRLEPSPAPAAPSVSPATDGASGTGTQSSGALDDTTHLATERS